jgi:hypothetical protein
MLSSGGCPQHICRSGVPSGSSSEGYKRPDLRRHTSAFERFPSAVARASSCDHRRVHRRLFRCGQKSQRRCVAAVASGRATSDSMWNLEAMLVEGCLDDLSMRTSLDGRALNSLRMLRTSAAAACRYERVLQRACAGRRGAAQARLPTASPVGAKACAGGSLMWAQFAGRAEQCQRPTNGQCLVLLC